MKLTVTLERPFQSFATVYDILYGDKDYERECQYIRDLFQQYALCPPVTSLLDIACGTGGHAIPLARQGLRVVAQDLSEEMARVGRCKAQQEGLLLEWQGGIPMQSLSRPERFDAIICLFSAIDYVLTDTELKSLFSRVRDHLQPQGVFVFDFWNRDAVEASYSPIREKRGSQGNRWVKRCSRTRLDRETHLATISMAWEMGEGNVLLERGEEVHTCRYFSIKEIHAMLTESGLVIRDTHPFLMPHTPLTSSTWNITVICSRSP